MSKLAAAAGAAALIFCAESASAAVVLDQSDVPEAGVAVTMGYGWDYVDSYGWGQAFTSGIDGVLDHIDLGVIAGGLTAPTGALTVAVTTMDRDVLFSRTYSPAAVPILSIGVTDWSQLFRVDVRAANIAVTAGQKLRIVVSSPDANQYGLLRQVDNVLLDTAGAELWYFRYLPPKGVVWSSNDTAFRTYVDTGSGAPEPAAWALMLAGFGLGGAVLRRRRMPPAAA